MIRVCHLLPAVLAVLTSAKEQQRSPYDSQRPLSASDAARRFDLTSEEQRCYDQQQFSGVEVEMLRTIDDQLRNGEISRVASRDPSTLSQNDKDMFRNRIYRAITRIAPDEHMAQVIRQKLENFVRCIAASNRRSYSGGRDRRE
ncbi:uncharacterized protein LOC119388782 [Rhipicephalus sanguineus]|uniref:uncharacterized protein LOC119388782 n=1 Tax=Rhipicephalus sanguineus TaxID=34632 RepID=UPI0018939D12|nr:uncharacterized protein LOC119388782 [Rhipicephalus sanguineus]